MVYGPYNSIEHLLASQLPAVTRPMLWLAFDCQNARDQAVSETMLSIKVSPFLVLLQVSNTVRQEHHQPPE